MGRKDSRGNPVSDTGEDWSKGMDGIFQRTGSLRATVSPKIKSFVDYSSGLFTLDNNDATPQSPKQPSDVETSPLPGESFTTWQLRRGLSRDDVLQHASARRQKFGYRSVVTMEDKPELFKSIEELLPKEKEVSTVFDWLIGLADLLKCPLFFSPGCKARQAALFVLSCGHTGEQEPEAGDSRAGGVVREETAQTRVLVRHRSRQGGKVLRLSPALATGSLRDWEYRSSWVGIHAVRWAGWRYERAFRQRSERYWFLLLHAFPSFLSPISSHLNCTHNVFRWVLDRRCPSQFDYCNLKLSILLWIGRKHSFFSVSFIT